MGFFEKLKKGVGIEEGVEAEKPTKKRERKIEKMAPIEKEEKPSFAKSTEGKKEWFEPEGQLAIDVFQTDGEIFIQSAIAGVSSENLDIVIENDVVTIKGNREKPVDELTAVPKDYFYQECYWGPFSRQVILPAEVDGSRAEAAMKEGILTIRIPKIEKEKKRKILVKE